MPIHHVLSGSLSLKRGMHSLQWHSHGALLGNAPSIVSGGGAPHSDVAPSMARHVASEE
jgi:hypothetical protein